MTRGSTGPTRGIRRCSTGATSRSKRDREGRSDSESEVDTTVSRQTTGCGGPSARVLRREAVAIVTGASIGAGREIARGLAGWGWAIVVVYLEQQRTTEATVAQIVAADGKVVAVRADLADDLDVQRLFAESSAAFAGVDVVVHTTAASPSLLYQHAARHVRRQGAIVSAAPADGVTPGVSLQLGERDISIGETAPEGVLSFLDRWRRQPLR
jgi:NAD(P)-dependent dehydrogenase (short-subunit alcohol dehydrogenase family)